MFSTQLCEKVPHVHGPIKRPAAAKSPKRRKKKKNRSRLLHCTHELTRLLDFSDAENLRTEVFNTSYLAYWESNRIADPNKNPDKWGHS